MPQNISAVNNSRIGTCPHGLPPGACPICSGGGGGAKKLGTMSWSECFAEGVRMRNAEKAAELRVQNPLYNANALSNFQQNMQTLINNVQQIMAVLQKTLPKPIADVLNVINNAIIMPVLTLISKIPQLIQNIQNAIATARTALAQLAEKLTSVFGELKNFIAKKTSETFEKFRKKLKKLFSIFGSDEEDEINAKNFLEVFSTKKEG